MPYQDEMPTAMKGPVDAIFSAITTLKANMKSTELSPAQYMGLSGKVSAIVATLATLNMELSTNAIATSRTRDARATADWELPDDDASLDNVSAGTYLDYSLMKRDRVSSPTDDRGCAIQDPDAQSASASGPSTKRSSPETLVNSDEDADSSLISSVDLNESIKVDFEHDSAQLSTNDARLWLNPGTVISPGAPFYPQCTTSEPCKNYAPVHDRNVPTGNSFADTVLPKPSCAEIHIWSDESFNLSPLWNKKQWIGTQTDIWKETTFHLGSLWKCEQWIGSQEDIFEDESLTFRPLFKGLQWITTQTDAFQDTGFDLSLLWAAEVAYENSLPKTTPYRLVTVIQDDLSIEAVGSASKSLSRQEKRAAAKAAEKAAKKTVKGKRVGNSTML